MQPEGWWSLLSSRRAGLRARLRRNPRGSAALALAALIAGAGWACVSALWYNFAEKRVAVVVPGHLVRGGWQRPGPLRRIIRREKIRTIVTLATVDDNEYRYLDQSGVVAEAGVRWIFVPMVNSSATLEQMAEAADLLGNTGLQPVYFHCVAGHHRTSLAHAAYRIRHDGWTAERALAELDEYPWTRAERDEHDRRLIRAFAERARSIRPSGDSFEWSLSLLSCPGGPGPPQPDAARASSRASSAASTAGHSSSMTLK